ncbi:MAG: hypothetical protein K2N89_13070 [Lachnospiraceae bacterium]|nr:hypothetical protein [Lachnospiraceae bacterium]
MVLVALNWIYILVTVFLCGFAFAMLVEKVFGYAIQNAVEILFFGLIVVTVYAQLFSLFMGVGAVANLVLVGACMLIFAVWRKKIAVLLYDKIQNRSLLYKITIIILIVIWCYCTSRGYMHYDSDLYHGQSIRWIEEYGVVKGLGNIHVRFAYNSSFFALSALYSMKFLTGQSLHTMNGFIALLLSVEVFAVFDKRRITQKNAVRLSDFARLGALYYLTLIYRDIVSPASDYCVMCVVFYLVIRWLTAIEEGEKNVAPYALLCVMGVYGITLKLTAGVILLLLVKPAYMLLKEKRYREIISYILLGVVVIAPWMIRTAFISGYLLYPFPELDILNVDWKIDAAAAALDAAEIKTWGRGLNNAALVDLPVSEWFPQWFQNTLPTLGKLFVLADVMCIVFLAIFVIMFFVGRKRKKAASDMAGELLALSAVEASYLFWQLSAPLLRYGYAYVLLLIALTAGLLYRRIQGKGSLLWCAAIILAVAKTVSFAGYVVNTAEKPYYVNQQDYGTYDLERFTVKGTAFYYPKSGDRTGYESFPAVPVKTEIAFRGETLRDGFMYVEKETSAKSEKTLLKY